MSTNVNGTLNYQSLVTRTKLKTCKIIRTQQKNLYKNYSKN